MKILITGGSGFVGKNFIGSQNNSGNTFTRISRQANADSEITWQQFFDTPESFGADIFLHLAGKAHDVSNTSDAQAYFEVNTHLTQRLFDAFLKSNAGTFIYMSSVKAAADSVNGSLTEDVIPSPLTPYGQSKQQAEAYILNADIPAGKRVFILRPCMIHGPGNKGNLNLLYKFVQKGIPYPLAAFNNQRSFLSIGNLNFILDKIITDNAINGGIYNLADDEPLSTNQVINIIAQASDIKPKLWPINASFIKAVAAIGDKLHLPLNSDRLKKLTESYVVSNQKIKNALAVQALPLTSTEGLTYTIKSFKNDIQS